MRHSFKNYSLWVTGVITCNILIEALCVIVFRITVCGRCSFTSRELGAFVARLGCGAGKVPFIYLLRTNKENCVRVYFLYARIELSCYMLRCPAVGCGALNRIRACEVCEACVM
jgi:hypothetical protein